MFKVKVIIIVQIWIKKKSGHFFCSFKYKKIIKTYEPVTSPMTPLCQYYHGLRFCTDIDVQIMTMLHVKQVSGIPDIYLSDWNVILNSSFWEIL